MNLESLDPVDLSACEQVGLLDARTISARELLDAHLARIDAYNPELNAIVAMDAEVGRVRAQAVDDARARGEAVGSLAGLVTAHKDLTDTKDFVTTLGSPLLANGRPSADSLLVERATRAGAVAVGKTNVPELGAGSHTINPVYGPTRNAWDPTKSAGGSSGGAAVALATGMVGIADGSDMGGSLRNPASWNGVVGFRNSPGVVPNVKASNGWMWLGTEGAMGRTVDDVALLLGVIGRPDPRDPLAKPMTWPDRPVAAPARAARAAWSPTLGGLPVDRAVADALATAVGRMADAGWEIVEGEPDFAGADECFETLRSWYFYNYAPPEFTPEALRSGNVKATLIEEFERGRALSSSAVARAFGQLTSLWKRSVGFFDDVDVLLCPVSQLSPFPVEWEYPTEVAGQPMERYLTWMRSACRITVMGSPALSVPAGLDSAGLPVGIQLVGAPGDDVGVLEWAKAAEQALAAPRWNDRRTDPATNG